MAADEDEVEEPFALPLDESLYVSEEDDTLEKVKRGFKQFGRGLKRGGEEIAAGSKKLASKSKEKLDSALEKRKQAKAMKDPLAFPWKSLSVADLKDRLRQLGLTVSGKKDDLVDRIMQHYRTEIPTTEDGTTELMGDLDQIPDVPPAPDLDSLPSTEVKIDDDQSAEPEVVEETPIHQFTEGEQLYVYEPSKNVKSKSDWKAKKINSTISRFFGFLIFLFTLSIIDYGFSMGLFQGPMSIINFLAAERVARPYGGMNGMQEATLAAILAMFFFFSSLLYISGKRQVAAALLAMFALLVSFSIRIYTAFSVDAFEDVNVLGLLIFDLVLSIPFTFTCWIPAMASSVLFSNDVVSSEFFVVQPEQSASAEPEPITDSSDEDYAGEDMGAFSVSRPPPPKRRQKGSWSIYELVFLGFSFFFWPLTIGTHFVMALGIHIEWINYTGDLDSDGKTLLLPLYLFCCILTMAVIKFDREARDGDVYAKEMLAYHADMDQYLDLKKVYYEKAADGLGLSSPPDEES